MEGFKSSDKRLVRLFQKSRDQWKKRAAEKQKKMRAMEIKLRDVSVSRDQWKMKAMAAQRQQEEFKKELEELKKNSEKSKSKEQKEPSHNLAGLKNQEQAELRPKGHNYLVYVIQIAIKFLVLGLNSLRGIEKNFEILAEDCSWSTPNFNTVRQWSLRLGLYELTRQKEYRKDWIFILDMTIELGVNKCLVVLGISQEKLSQIIEKEGRSLYHKDVEVLGLEILEKSSGEVILEKLNNLAEQVGTPVQIVSDWGSDIKKGIDLYRQKNPSVIATYDVTHKMANLLKKELDKDEHFQNFLQQCSLTRQRVQQTELYFLIPPTQRAKARYHNLDILVEWARKVLKYEERQDFSLISNSYNLDREALELLSSNLREDVLIMLKGMSPRLFENRDEFTQALLSNLGQELWTAYGEFICQCCDEGRRKFYAQLGWLLDYRQELQIYTEMLTLIQTVQTQLKTQGLHRQSLEQWLATIKNYSLTSRGELLQHQISEYLKFEAEQIQEKQILLGASDIIESLFGKYKLLAARRPLKEISTSILLIPLATLEITNNLVKQAMEAIRFTDVCSWAKSVFGSSMLSLRRTLKLADNSDTELA